jgi:4'-phosphopantetheinyl transferase
VSVARFAAVADVQVAGRLTDAEVRRRDRLVRPEDRAAYEAAHLLVRACVGELCGLDVGSVVIEQRCDGCGSREHGRPYVADAPSVHVSLSHTEGLVAAVASYAPCGIDVQTTATTVPARGLTSAERAWVAAEPDPTGAFTRLWVRKEAVFKAGRPSGTPRSSGREPSLGQIEVLVDALPAVRVLGLELREWAVGESIRPVAWGCVAD